MSRIYPVLMPLGVTVWDDRERWKVGEGGVEAADRINRVKLGSRKR